MSPESETVKILWEIFGLPMLALLLILIGEAVLSAWVDYQIRKGGRQ